MNHISLQSSEISKRLDQMLHNRYPQFSRHWIQKLIKQGHVRINGKTVSPDYRLKPSDQLSFKLVPPEPKTEPLKPDPKVKFKVVYEDNACAVVEKPSGLVVHPSETVRWGTLVNGLLHRWPQMEGVGEDPQRPGIVHRLDRGASGLMIVAKTNLAFEHLKKQFQERLVEKRYLALLLGRTPKLADVIIAPIGRSKSDPLRQSVSGLKEAVTEYEVIRRFQNHTLVEAKPKTGRMHQLRVHFAYIGHPIAGDDTYASKRLKPPHGLNRLFLHASYLKIALPSGKEKEFESELPKELATILTAIEKLEKSRK